MQDGHRERERCRTAGRRSRTRCRLIGTVPTVFCGRRREDASDLTGGSDLTDGATGPGSGGAPRDPRKGEDAQAQASLNNAIRVAQVYFAENGSFAGFGPQVATQNDPSVTFTIGPAAPGGVGLRGLSRETVVFVTGTEPGYLCARPGRIDASGRTDAQSPAECTGGWARPGSHHPRVRLRRDAHPDPNRRDRRRDASVITVRRDDEISDVEGEWFRARWHFSFDTYHDPA